MLWGGAGGGGSVESPRAVSAPVATPVLIAKTSAESLCNRCRTKAREDD